MAREQESRPERVRATQSFLHDSYTDYIAARVLLLRGLLKQAAVLSSTAIEKCAKAVLAMRGDTIRREHLKASHWNALEQEENFGAKLNREFVELNQSVYRLRYSDNLPVGFNVAIASREFLAELDHTVLTVHSCYNFAVAGSWRPSGYESGLRNQDYNLLAENHLLSNEATHTFVATKPQFVYEARRNRVGLFEATYMTAKPARTEGFLRKGLRVVDAATGLFETSHFPMKGTLLLLLDGLERFGREADLGGGDRTTKDRPKTAESGPS
jgi:HEPN domain-containing protein